MLSPKQLEYLSQCNHRWNLKVGATGSGKSWLDYAVVIPKRLLEFSILNANDMLKQCLLEMSEIVYA